MTYETSTQVWRDKRPRRLWQNLLHQKCPTCDTKMQDDPKRGLFICPNQSTTDPTKNCFVIRKENAAAFLLDPEHPAHRSLSQHEKATLQQALATMGIDYIRPQKE